MNKLMIYAPRLVSICGLCLMALLAAQARADAMYQCVDESGHKSFSNIKSVTRSARCSVMDLGEPVAVPAPKAAAPKTPTPASFPKVDDNAQKARDVDRRRILEGELTSEQQGLEQAKRDLAEQESTILPSERTQSKGGSGVNGAKVDERVQQYRDKVALHERNIEAIQKEISRLQ